MLPCHPTLCDNIHTGRHEPEDFWVKAVGVACLCWERIPVYVHSLRAGGLPKAWVPDVLQHESDTDTVVDGKSIGLVKAWLLPQCLGSHLGVVGKGLRIFKARSVISTEASYFVEKFHRPPQFSW